MTHSRIRGIPPWKTRPPGEREREQSVKIVDRTLVPSRPRIRYFQWHLFTAGLLDSHCPRVQPLTSFPAPVSPLPSFGSPRYTPMRSDDTFVNWVSNKSAFLTLYISRHPPPLPVPLFISYLRDDARPDQHSSRAGRARSEEDVFIEKLRRDSGNLIVTMRNAEKRI